MLTRSALLELSTEELTKKVAVFYAKFTGLLTKDLFTKATEAKTALRESLLPELKNATAEEVTKNHGITDLELRNRMKHEWKPLKT
jgi:hypothetical protein